MGRSRRSSRSVRSACEAGRWSAVPSWAYIWLAWALPAPGTPTGIAVIAGVHAYEQFAAGLGNAVLVVFIMRTCSAVFKAAHYAIASAVASVGGTLFDGFGGIFV